MTTISVTQEGPYLRHRSIVMSSQYHALVSTHHTRSPYCTVGELSTLVSVEEREPSDIKMPHYSDLINTNKPHVSAQRYY